MRMHNGFFFDLHKELNTNVEFINRVQKEMQDINNAQESGDNTAVTFHVANLLRMCDYNPAILTPYYFPNFAKGKPMTLWSRPHAVAMMSVIPTGELTVQASRQIGKCVAGDTKLQIRDDSTGTESTITIEELFDSI